MEESNSIVSIFTLIAYHDETMLSNNLYELAWKNILPSSCYTIILDQCNKKYMAHFSSLQYQSVRWDILCQRWGVGFFFNRIPFLQLNIVKYWKLSVLRTLDWGWFRYYTYEAGGMVIPNIFRYDLWRYLVKK